MGESGKENRGMGECGEFSRECGDEGMWESGNRKNGEMGKIKELGNVGIVG
jgi:hypothetical protein